MHTEKERKWLAWAETCRLITLVELATLDGVTNYDGSPRYNGPYENYEVGSFARWAAHEMGTTVLRDWIRQQPEWNGNAGPARWVNTNIRDPEQVADAIRELWLRWMKGTTPPFVRFTSAIDKHGGRLEVDRYHVTYRGIGDLREMAE